MCVFGFGFSAARALRAASMPILLALLAASQGGCANKGTYAANPSDVAVNNQPQHYVEMEADGLPVQAAPLPRARNGDDDATQPFSRNYGGPNPAAMSKPANSKVSLAPVAPAESSANRSRLADASNARAY